MRHDGGDTLKSQDYHAGLRVLPLKAMECGNYQEAAEHHKVGHDEKAAHHAQTARGHHEQAPDYALEAAKSHTEHYGKK